MPVVIESDEFTWDMVRGLPRANYYATCGQEVRVQCKKGLSSIYKLITPHVKEIDKFREGGQRDTYNIKGPKFIKNEWTPPNLQKMFEGKLKRKLPCLTIQNKYTMEWLKPPVNYFPKEVLREILTEVRGKYHVFYIRPRQNTPNYFVDLNEMMEFSDYDMIKTEFPEVTTIYDIVQEIGLDYNCAQFAAHAASTKHISVSGGNACVAAYFGGDLVIYDSLKGKSGRGIWKTGSWLSKLGKSNINGFNHYEKVLEWIGHL